MKVLFSSAKFCENKTLMKWQNHSVLSDVGKSCSSHEFLTSQTCPLTLLTKMKFSPNLQYFRNMGEASVESCITITHI